MVLIQLCTIFTTKTKRFWVSKLQNESVKIGRKKTVIYIHLINCHLTVRLLVICGEFVFSPRRRNFPLNIRKISKMYKNHDKFINILYILSVSTLLIHTSYKTQCTPYNPAQSYSCYAYSRKTTATSGVSCICTPYAGPFRSAQFSPFMATHHSNPP